MTGSDVQNSLDLGLGSSGIDQGSFASRSSSAGRDSVFSAVRRQNKHRFESDRERLLTEISRTLEELDEAGLVQILDTAAMIRYNQNLLKANEEAQGQELPFEEVVDSSLRIERSRDGSTYHLLAGKVWKILAAEEIAALLRIARHEAGEAEAAKHLYQWIRQERKDIAVDLHIPSSGSAVLKELLALLTETFPVRSPRRP